MEKRTAVVTGGSRGIGRGICLKFADLGYNLVINFAGNEEAAVETKKLCEAKGVAVVLVKGSVSDYDLCMEVIDKAIENFGKIDILVNNAGITRDNVLIRMKEDEFDQVIDTNLKGTFNMMKAVCRPMMKAKYGRIVNISSVVGLMGNSGQINYAASKAGVIGMTKSMAREVASRGITVNAVAPGFIQTDMTDSLPDEVVKSISMNIPVASLGKVEDVAGAVAFLSDERSSYITGQVLCVDGGMAMM